MKNCPLSSSVSLGVSLGTATFLLGLITMQSLAKTIIDLGQASEEVFRGDRLPVLNFPEQALQARQDE